MGKNVSKISNVSVTKFSDKNTGEKLSVLFFSTNCLFSLTQFCMDGKNFVNTQRLFSGEIVRDSLIFRPKISLKLAKWEEKSHTKQLFSQTILPVFPQKIHNFSLVLAWREIFYQGILEPELSLNTWTYFSSHSTIGVSS